MSTTQRNLAEASEKYAASFTEGHLALPPAKKYAVVTCMDARIDPASAFGIALGDAHVIRNAGGNAEDALRSLVISQQLLGTNEIVVVKHKGCGMLTFSNSDALGVVETNLGQAGLDAVNSSFSGDFQPFPEAEAAVQADLTLLSESPLIKKGTTLSGWVYDVETGQTSRVV